MTTDVLFRPFRIGTRELANRIVMAPMTRSTAVDGIRGGARGLRSPSARAGWA